LVADRLIIDCGDLIASTEAGLLRGAPWPHVVNNRRQIDA